MMNYDELVDKISLYEIDLDEEQIFDLLRIKSRWPYTYTNTDMRSVEIITETGALTSNFFDVSRRGVWLNFDRWHEYYEKGFTTILSNVFDLTKQLRQLERMLTSETGLECLGNFYLGRPGRKPSFDVHTHDYDVIVKQIYGSAEWTLGDTTLHLQPQQVIHIPKHTPHGVTNSKEKRLSLTINIM